MVGSRDGERGKLVSGCNKGGKLEKRVSGRQSEREGG